MSPIQLNLNALSSFPIQHQQQHAHHQIITNIIQPCTAAALTPNQLLVSDVWKEVTRQYVDTTYNNLGEDKWAQKRLEAIKAVSNVGPDDQEMVYETIRNMLSVLNDPYTRFLTPEQYEAIVTAYGRGGNAGIGVQLIVDPRLDGKVVVFNTVKNGPAAKVGVMPGDVVMEVDGVDVSDGTMAEVVASKCRGEIGTDVDLVVLRRQDDDDDAASSDTIKKFTMTRALVKANAVETSSFTTKNGQQTVGVLKVPAFNQETVSQLMEGLKELKQGQNDGNGSISSIVLDLRGNVGGYMPAGVDAAKLFLSPRSRIISEVDKSNRATIYINDGIGSETTIPLYVLVDSKTASASEILTAALQDNNRAVVVGKDSKTFGKGRIQNVQALEDGSGVSVTRARYMTPKGRDIQGVGITPDRIVDSCGKGNSAADCLKELI